MEKSLPSNLGRRMVNNHEETHLRFAFDLGMSHGVTVTRNNFA